MNKRIIFALIAALVLSSPAAAQEREEAAPVKPVLLVIDIQNRYIPMMDESERESAMRMINGLIHRFREHGLPVVRVYHTSPEWGPEPGSKDFEFPDSVLVKDSDPKIVKNFPSAFTGTELERTLEELGANAVFLCGLSATGCVLATYFGAMEHGHDVFMVEGAVMSADAEKTEAITGIVHSVDVVGLAMILKAVSGSRPAGG